MKNMYEWADEGFFVWIKRKFREGFLKGKNELPFREAWREHAEAMKSYALKGDLSAHSAWTQMHGKRRWLTPFFDNLASSYFDTTNWES